MDVRPGVDYVPELDTRGRELQPGDVVDLTTDKGGVRGRVVVSDEPGDVDAPDGPRMLMVDTGDAGWWRANAATIVDCGAAEDRKRRKTLRVDKLIVGREAMAQPWDVGAGRVSRTKAPLDVWYKPDCAGQPVDGYLLTDGHHRLVELLMRGPAESFTWSEVEVRQVGSGYNDYWRTPAPEERFVFTKTRYGGLEALADEDILATDTAKLVGGAAEDALDPHEVPVNRLYSPRWKLEETLTEVRDGKLSRSNEQPLRLTRLDSPRGSFFILDGNHRAVEAVLAGKRTVTGIIDPEMPRIERIGGAHRDAVASKVNVVEFVRESERGGAAEDVIKLDRDAVYNGAERVVQAYARGLKRVPFDKGARRSGHRSRSRRRWSKASRPSRVRP